MEEDEPRRKTILYEDLRLKNRENYEVALTQKAETLLKSTPERERERPQKEGKLLLRRCVKTLAGLGKVERVGVQVHPLSLN